MTEYYLLPCKCMMSCKKINEEEYYWTLLLPRCISAKGGESYTTESNPETYSATQLSKFEATMEMLKGK